MVVDKYNQNEICTYLSKYHNVNVYNVQNDLINIVSNNRFAFHKYRSLLKMSVPLV